jgi:arsenate reductase-like glutaredoxin family protein
MPVIDWMYDRKSCKTCQRARGYLGECKLTARETVDATKVRIAPAEALALLAGVDRVVAAKGKKVVTFDLTADRPDDETLLAAVIGPSGNLRAPAVRVGKTMLIGFTDEMYREVLGQ